MKAQEGVMPRSSAPPHSTPVQNPGAPPTHQSKTVIVIPATVLIAQDGNQRAPPSHHGTETITRQAPNPKQNFGATGPGTNPILPTNTSPWTRHHTPLANNTDAPGAAGWTPDMTNPRLVMPCPRHITHGTRNAAARGALRRLATQAPILRAVGCVCASRYPL